MMKAGMLTGRGMIHPVGGPTFSLISFYISLSFLYWMRVAGRSPFPRSMRVGHTHGIRHFLLFGAENQSIHDGRQNKM